MITVSAFRWVPEFAQGLVRDLRVRWALEEVGLDYRVRLFGQERPPEYVKEQPFDQVPCFRNGEVQIFADYMDRVAAAVEARNELLTNPNQAVISETVQEVISRRRDQIKARRVKRWKRASCWHTPERRGNQGSTIGRYLRRTSMARNASSATLRRSLRLRAACAKR